MFQVPFRDPGIFFSQISLPLNQEGAGGQRSAVSDDLLNFVFLSSIDKVRGWHREVFFMNDILFVQSEKGSMEDWINLPGFW